ncbi:MAG: 3-oxoacyl-ACP synthase [Crocinitomicaceae bacterium]|nr:3-oxoacyl-ACP synthase [Crocinitomicaceae bacterium]
MKITTSSYISAAGAFLNGQQKFTFRETNWQKECYQQLGLDYPKFHKMDHLSKMTVLATELIYSEGHLNALMDDEPELLFANANASQHTDMKFIESYTQQGNPSPSLFVYTLPNILTGELAIRHKWYGENTFFITPQFDSSLFAERLYHAARKGGNWCLCGWVESKVDEKNKVTEECFLFLVALTDNTADHSSFAAALDELLTNYRNGNSGNLNR